MAEFDTGQIICTAVDTGRTHDFKLLKRSRLPFVCSQLCLADRGYQGFAKLHAGACTPTKKPRKQPLPQEEKQHNRALARLRVRIEQVIRRFQVFRIFSGRYRNGVIYLLLFIIIRQCFHFLGNEGLKILSTMNI